MNRRARVFGDFVIVLFLVAQMLDGVLTYVGIHAFGPSVEANPVLSWLMDTMGIGPALATAKVTAAGLGAVLHLHEVHLVIAALTAVYVAAAVVPWTSLLFF